MIENENENGIFSLGSAIKKNKKKLETISFRFRIKPEFLF
jgi:hypothetical protein